MLKLSLKAGGQNAFSGVRVNEGAEGRIRHVASSAADGYQLRPQWQLRQNLRYGKMVGFVFRMSGSQAAHHTFTRLKFRREVCHTIGYLQGAPWVSLAGMATCWQQRRSLILHFARYSTSSLDQHVCASEHQAGQTSMTVGT